VTRTVRKKTGTVSITNQCTKSYVSELSNELFQHLETYFFAQRDLFLINFMSQTFTYVNPERTVCHH